MRLSRFIPVALAAVAALPAVASAQSVQFLGAKFTTGTTVLIGSPFAGGTAAVGPYQMQFAGPGNSPFDIYCIDFDNQFSGTSPFNARILSFSDAVSSVLTFNGVDNFTALKRVLGTTSEIGFPISSSDYLNRLIIESAMAQQFGATPQPDWDENHYGMWQLFSGGPIFQPDNPAGVNGLLLSGAGTASTPGYDYSNWRIILDESAWDAQAHGSYQQGTITEVTSVVPEPGTYALVGAGLLALAGAARRRNRSTTSQMV